MKRFVLLLVALGTWFTLFIANAFADTVFLKAPPKFEGMYLLQTLLIVVSSCLFVIAVGKPEPKNKVGVIQPSQSSSWLKWGVFTWSVEESVKRDRFSIPVKELILWQVLIVSLAFVSVFLYNPKIFNALALEDNPIELLSALMWLIACAFFLLISVKLRSTRRRNRLFYIATALMFALILFLLGMEEISWFQRSLAIDTPEAFQGNLQNEMNLHNFATSYVEVCYYFSSFAWLVVIPFIKHIISNILPIGKRTALFFVPSQFMIFAGAISVAYNYYMWNQITTQIAFFVTLFTLIYTIIYSRSNRNKILLVSTVAVYVFTQGVFLLYGSSLVRTWDVTEYKEFLIPLSFVIYSLEILSKANKLKRSQAKEHHNSAQPMEF
ncbi:hypothetical protein NDI49_27545 [Trichocoleus sp. ST-U3]